MLPQAGDVENGQVGEEWQPRMPAKHTNAIGHPIQSRGLSPRDRTPWGTLLITGFACLLLGKAFLTLQANYEREMLDG